MAVETPEDGEVTADDAVTAAELANRMAPPKRIGRLFIDSLAVPDSDAIRFAGALNLT